jgi:guanylate kinase
MSSESRSGDAVKMPAQQDGVSPTPTARGNLIVVSAPSGAGKSSLAERALKRVEGLEFSISYTTREPRGAERDGVDYHFISEDEFRAMSDRGEFLESAEVHGYLYATHRASVEALLAQGLDVILDIDVQGAEQVRKRVAEAITVFILPPSREILEARLRSRNLNEPADLERRLQNAAVEVRLYENFDYVIVNDDLDRALASLEAIITAERCRLSRQGNNVESIVNTFGGD